MIIRSDYWNLSKYECRILTGCIIVLDPQCWPYIEIFVGCFSQFDTCPLLYINIVHAPDFWRSIVPYPSTETSPICVPVIPDCKCIPGATNDQIEREYWLTMMRKEAVRIAVIGMHVFTTMWLLFPLLSIGIIIASSKRLGKFLTKFLPTIICWQLQFYGHCIGVPNQVGYWSDN